jgi:dUTP pyrophosphatase
LEIRTISIGGFFRVIKFYREDWADESIPLPQYESRHAVGMDARANLRGLERGGVTIHPGKHVLIPLGLKCSFSPSYEMQVRPRSGLALKHGVTVLNSPGTIDPDYRGPLGVVLINHGPKPFEVQHGMRIAQLVMSPRLQFDIAEAYDEEELGQTDRGSGGWGSTGVK